MREYLQQSLVLHKIINWLEIQYLSAFLKVMKYFLKNFKKNSKKIKSLNFCDDSMQKGDFEDEHPGTWIPEDTAKRNPLDRCISLRDT